MSAPRCSRLWQAEAIADGRLSHPDVAAFERHAAGCAECAREVSELERLQRLTAGLPPLHASEIERRRQRYELLRKANEATVRARPARARLVASVALGTIMVSAASAFGLRAAWQELTAGEAPARERASTNATPTRSPKRAAPPPSTDSPREDSAASPLLAPAAEPEPERQPEPEPEPISRHARSKRLAPAPSNDEQAPRAGVAFAKAMAAFTAGDYGSAQALFAAFEREHGSDDRVEDALFLRAVAHARRGDRSASRAAATEYLKRYPNGLRRREAEELTR